MLTTAGKKKVSYELVSEQLRRISEEIWTERFLLSQKM